MSSMPSPRVQTGSRTWKQKEAAKDELRKTIARGIREEARQSEEVIVREALRNVADMVEGEDFERSAG